jgi:hypothetical protein
MGAGAGAARHRMSRAAPGAAPARVGGLGCDVDADGVEGGAGDLLGAVQDGLDRGAADEPEQAPVMPPVRQCRRRLSSRAEINPVQYWSRGNAAVRIMPKLGGAVRDLLAVRGGASNGPRDIGDGRRHPSQACPTGTTGVSQTPQPRSQATTRRCPVSSPTGAPQSGACISYMDIPNARYAPGSPRGSRCSAGGPHGRRRHRPSNCKPCSTHSRQATVCTSTSQINKLLLMLSSSTFVLTPRGSVKLTALSRFRWWLDVLMRHDRS